MHRTQVLFLWLLLYPTLTEAQSWVCPPKPGNTNNQLQPRALSPQEVNSPAIRIEADQALFRDKGQSLLEGDVIISRNSTQLRADLATFERETQQVSAQGNVYLISDGLELRSSAIRYNLADDTGTLDQADYQFANSNGRGKSEQLRRETGNITRLKEASYTTCPVGNNSWSINAEDIELDHSSEQGTARNLSFQVNGTPLIYLPYFSFPISDKRKSGFLTPSLATDEKSGVRVSLPYYLNLAPNYDLTLTPELISKRGIQLSSEFRYLLKKHDGRLLYEFLPEDNERDGDTRYYFDLEHYSHTGPNSEVTLLAAGVSDNNYFQDLGTSLAASSIVKLERTLSYTKDHKDWSTSALLQDYQVLDNTTEAYARLPQLTLNWHPQRDADQLQHFASVEYTYFAEANAIDGHRFDLQAGIKQKFANHFAYFTPSLELRHTSYSLDRDTDDTQHRTLPTASFKTGMFFERELKKGKWLQTLEPALFYTYTPFHDQSNIPIFDSSNRTLSYSQLFSSNRFTGKDRVEDANRLSTSLTTRLHDVDQGRELFRASIGQMYHFDDRQVALPDEVLESGSRSELVFEGAGELNKSTRLTATAFIDTDDKSVSASQLKLNYKDEKERLLNLGYSQRKNEYEAAHLSFATPVSQNWRFAGGYERDLKNNRTLETVFGLEYRSCCWKSRIAARKYLLSDNSTYDDAIFVEMELKGLGNFGSGARNFLGNRIYGYE